MNLFDTVILRHLANFLAPGDFFTFRLLARRFNQAMKGSEAETRCRVQVQTTFTPKPGHPQLGSYALVQQKIEELSTKRYHDLNWDACKFTDIAKLVVSTPRLYQRFVPPRGDCPFYLADNFWTHILIDQPSVTPNIIKNMEMYLTCLIYLSAEDIRNTCYGSKVFFIYLLKKKKLLKSLYQSNDHEGKPRRLCRQLSDVFKRYPEVQHYSENVLSIVAQPQKKFKKLKKIAKEAIPLLEETLTEQERSYLW